MAPARDRLRAPRRLGRLLALEPASARPGSDRGGGERAAVHARCDRAPALCVRGGALRPALPAASGSDARRGGGRLHVARGGDNRDRLRPQLARLVVGMARPDGRCVRPRRVRRPPGVPPQALNGGALQGSLPRAHWRADRPALRERPQRAHGRENRHADPARTRALQRRGGAAPRAGRRGAAAARRALQPVPLAAADEPAPRATRCGRARRRAARDQRPFRRPPGVHRLLGALDATGGGRDAERVLGRGRSGGRRGGRDDRALRRRRGDGRLQRGRRPARSRTARSTSSPRVRRCVRGRRPWPPGVAALPRRREQRPGRDRERRRDWSSGALRRSATRRTSRRVYRPKRSPARSSSARPRPRS